MDIMCRILISLKVSLGSTSNTYSSRIKYKIELKFYRRSAIRIITWVLVINGPIRGILNMVTIDKEYIHTYIPQTLTILTTY